MKIDIEKVAALAKLRLKEGEKQKLEKDLGNILSYVEQLNQLDTSKVEPTSHVLNLENVFREDVIKPWLVRDELLKHAPQAKGKFFEVPKVIEENS